MDALAKARAAREAGLQRPTGRGALLSRAREAGEVRPGSEPVEGEPQPKPRGIGRAALLARLKELRVGEGPSAECETGPTSTLTSTSRPTVVQRVEKEEEEEEPLISCKFVGKCLVSWFLSIH